MIRTITIVSLSSGIAGEPFMDFELKIGLQRLQALGIRVKFAKHALEGFDELKNHPEKRAEDLLEAFQDSETDMILCAIGGDDTYRLLPYLFEHDELKNAVRRKIFLGFSDTTMNHFMLRKVGLNTFYGQAFLPDVCELSETMLPYTEQYLKELLTTGMISKITPSDIWYDAREQFSESEVGTELPSHPNQGFELLQGPSSFDGPIFGGCIDTIFDMFDNSRYADSVELCTRYHLFPSRDEWNGQILLLETSEETASPEKYRNALEALKAQGVFDAVNGVLIGKPINEIYVNEYKTALKEVIANPDLPVVCNVNIGHALPRCIIPFGVPAHVDVNRQEITFAYERRENREVVQI